MSDVDPNENVAPTAEEYALYADESLSVKHGWSFHKPSIDDLAFRWEDRANFDERAGNADPVKIATLRRCAKELRDTLARLASDVEG